MNYNAKAVEDARSRRNASVVMRHRPARPNMTGCGPVPAEPACRLWGGAGAQSSDRAARPARPGAGVAAAAVAGLTRAIITGSILLDDRPQRQGEDVRPPTISTL